MRAVVALFQGLLLWWLYHAAKHDLWPATHPGLLVGLATAAAAAPLAKYLVEGLAPVRKQLAMLAPLALVLFGLGWHEGAWAADEPHGEHFTFVVALAVLLFHALPFLQARLASGTWRPRYDALFHFASRNVLLGVLGAAFTGVFWLLLLLWGRLFDMLGIDFFDNLFQEEAFAIPATAVAVGVGVQLAGSVERLQAVLRQQVLASFKWLLPLVVLILVLFTAALLVKSPALLLEQRRAISATWLLWLVAVAVALLNAAYQDGGIESPYPRWLGNSIRWAVPLLVPIAVLAAIALAIRADHYGLTVPRAWAFAVAAVALAYAGGYAWAALRRPAWMGGMGAVNVGVALGTVIMVAAMLTPLLSPERLAAASQYRRAIREREDGSFVYLRFDSGRYGRERLAALAKLTDYPAAAEIRGLAGRELEKPGRWQPPTPLAKLVAEDFEVFPAGAPLDAKLLAAIHRSREEQQLEQCNRFDPCPVLMVDLSRDGVPEAIVFSGYDFSLATRNDVGDWHWVRAEGQPMWSRDRTEVRAALKQGRYEVRDLPWQVLELDGSTLVFEDRPDDDRTKETPETPVGP